MKASNILDYLFASGLENPALNDPNTWLVDWFGGRKTVSGERVTSETAMTLSVYYACLRNVAEDMGKLPLILYKRLDPRGKDRATSHPLYRLLHDEPNSEMCSVTFVETLQHHAAAWGNGYAEIERDGANRPISLWPIHPSRVMVKRNSSRLYYEVRVDDLNAPARVVAMDAENIFHLRGLGPSGVEGYSVLRLAAETIGLTIAAQKFGAAFFANGANPGGLLTHPSKLSPEAAKRLRESWEAKHAGASNTHRVAVLEEGMKWEKMGVPPEEAQFLQTRQFQVEDVCRWFRMPPSKVGHLERAQGWSTLETMNRDYVTDTLMPWAARWRQEIARKLLAEKERDVYFAEFLFLALLQADAKDRAEFYTKMLGNGSMSPNDIREAENMNPIDGGDIYLVPNSYQTVDNAGAKPEPPAEPQPPTPPHPEPAKDDSAAEAVARMRVLFEDAAQRVVSMSSNDYGKRLAYCTKAFAPIFRTLDISSSQAIAPALYAGGANAEALAEAMMNAAIAELATKEKARAA